MKSKQRSVASGSSKRCAWLLTMLAGCADEPRALSPDVANEAVNDVALETTSDIAESSEVAGDVSLASEISELGAPLQDMPGAGTIELTWPLPEEAAFGVEPMSYIYSDPRTGWVAQYERVALAGECSAWRYTPTLCEPPCGGYSGCDLSAQCVPWPRALDMGEITVRAGDDVATLTPERPPHSDDLYEPQSHLGTFGDGAPVQFTIAGYGDIASFEVTLPHVTAPHFGPLQNQVGAVDLPLSDDAPVTLTWTPDITPGLEVGLVLYSGHHGAPPTRIIRCAAPDAVGALTLEPEVAAWFDPSLEGNNHAHIVYRLAIVQVETAAGPITLRTGVRRFITPLFD